MASYLEDLSSNFQVENPMSKVVFEITNLIKYDNNYDEAVKMILDNNLKLEDIVNTTIRLRRDQLINLAVKLISIKIK